jgi:hypothetical protein
VIVSKCSEREGRVNELGEMDGGVPGTGSVETGWLIWFIWLVLFNQINKTNQINQINLT